MGQPELRDKLNDTELRQLAQRITARYHLTPLDRDETEAYVRHRLAVAGAARSPFSRLGLRALYRRSGGVPRLINVIADRALMAGYAREQDSIGERLVDRAADETLPGTRALLAASLWPLGRSGAGLARARQRAVPTLRSARLKSPRPQWWPRLPWRRRPIRTP